MRYPAALLAKTTENGNVEAIRISYDGRPDIMVGILFYFYRSIPDVMGLFLHNEYIALDPTIEESEIPEDERPKILFEDTEDFIKNGQKDTGAKWLYIYMNGKWSLVNETKSYLIELNAETVSKLSPNAVRMLRVQQ